jgi:hypothetical protein
LHENGGLTAAVFYLANIFESHRKNAPAYQSMTPEGASIMLNIDVEQTKGRLKNSMAAATAVTQNAQATVTVVPILPDPPDWYVPVQNDLLTSQDHANDWLNTICPAVNGGLPAQLIAFNGAFQSSSGSILDVINASGAGSLTAEQRATVDESIAALRAAVATQEQSVISLVASIRS